MHRYEDLVVWRMSVDLAVAIEAASNRARRTGGLFNQLRRAAVSIGSNIAEGCGRATDNEFIHFLSIARGSAAEVDTQLRIAFRSGHLSRASFDPMLASVQRIRWMLTALMRAQT